MTKSHLYVPIFPPKKLSQPNETFGDALDNIPPIIQSDRHVADKNLVLRKSNDKHKELHMIHLETQFYITFRNKMRQLLNSFSQTDISVKKSLHYTKMTIKHGMKNWMDFYRN